MRATPALSVVVALTSGRQDDLRRCLAALHEQTFAGPIETIVPYDDACAEAVVQSAFPAVRFLRAEGLETRRARTGSSREHHDTLRTIGIRAATSEYVAMTEDHAHVGRTWCQDMVEALERYPKAAAIGGAIECGTARGLTWAVWLCDFGRYQSPLPDDRTQSISDTNVAYRRRSLEQIADAWANGYHETTVHQALLDAGFELRTIQHAVAWQARAPLGLGAALRERYVWGRSFAGTRARAVGGWRWALAVLVPLLPFVTTGRLVRVSFQRGRHVGRLAVWMPVVVLLQSAWAAGELLGYVTADPD